MPKPLEGLRVLDFTHALAGPYCTMLLATYGADVYKVEGTGTEDMGRTWGPPFQGGQASYFLGINAGKQALAINLKSAEGIALCRELIAHADVLIENMRPGTMTRLGLGWDVAQGLNPRLVYCSISGRGQYGPGRDDPAMDLIMQAASGLISMTGTADGDTARCGHSVADITSGMFSLIGILMALRVREQTGRGQFVDVSMLDSMISAMASNFANFLGSGVSPRPLGTAFSTIVPYKAFPAKDREMVIAAASEKLWQGFCEAVEHPEWAADPRFATNPLRVKNREMLEPMIDEVLQTRTAGEWGRLLAAQGVPSSPVRTLDEVIHDPQAQVREMFPVVEHPTAGPVVVTGAPIKFSETPGQVERAAPLPGQHTREALMHLLGLDAAAIDSLIARGVVK
ncbi:MAG: CoA transferase [Acidobacteria bacterium]|nr:CoA transferase [Acidobacteriota bacterium]